ncbi:MAG: CBS domain-containing protein [Bryobacteraceae bacterium]|nr:CBS domain-containing protein [Bryobacteraceae bacterium]MDW8377060.1 CBS domain-containing protein [Bryobacterales bacterium]
MTIQEVMKASPATVAPDETFGHAFALMMEQKLTHLPVVGSEGVYLGMFDLRDIWQVLLPKAALLAMDSLSDLAFFYESKKQLIDKLRHAANRRVEEFLKEEDAPLEVYPDMPVIEAVLLLHRHDGVLPVVDRKSRRLVGMVGAWDILERLR